MIHLNCPAIASSQDFLIPNRAVVPMPRVAVPYTRATPYRLPGRRILIFLKDTSFRTRNIYSMDLETGSERQLTDLKPGTRYRFRRSLDGPQIVFDRQKEKCRCCPDRSPSMSRH